jgi:hypothetical protein
MQVKTSIQTFPGFKKKVMAYVREKGHEPSSKSRLGKYWFEIVGPVEAMSHLLTDLRYDFPIGYVQGWTEPV